MRSVRIVVFLSVIGLVCTPFLITRSHAERAAGKRETPLATKGTTTIAPLAQPQQRPEQLQTAVFDGPRTDAAPINPEVLERLGLGQQQSQAQSAKLQTAQGITPASAGLPTNMAASAAFSAAVATTVYLRQRTQNFSLHVLGSLSTRSRTALPKTLSTRQIRLVTSMFRRPRISLWHPRLPAFL